MPRQARLDAPGVLHHVVLRGIEKRWIVDDGKARRRFFSRLGNAASSKGMTIYAVAKSLMRAQRALSCPSRTSPMSQIIQAVLESRWSLSRTCCRAGVTALGLLSGSFFLATESRERVFYSI